MSDLLQIDIKQVRAAQDASRSLARLAILMRWAGEGLATASRSDLTPAQARSFGLAVTWAGEEIERQCTAIDEAI
ncbi:hypothetical protein AA11826_1261 [Komagataeibacter oboediens DSM 11826]|uniref:Uncharacterized protein n=1 Tax=Komagataeibacter oboediens TaxID=65958 RepID=A0A318QP65_9PROT|nr:hypothetical protein [Komagataeibacter oboediens]PYD81507.1 hypothetical protein CFR80_11285 [Komagataeibacter oboediens]GBR34664.1 hypothetical protein AA11826_1261 [Komagataeibacter oboediens DSM 11826]